MEKAADMVELSVFIIYNVRTESKEAADGFFPSCARGGAGFTRAGRGTRRTFLSLLIESDTNPRSRKQPLGMTDDWTNCSADNSIRL